MKENAPEEHFKWGQTMGELKSRTDDRAGLCEAENVTFECGAFLVDVLPLQVEYIDIPERTTLNVPGYSKPVEFGMLTSFA